MTREKDEHKRNPRARHVETDSEHETCACSRGVCIRNTVRLPVVDANVEDEGVYAVRGSQTDIVGPVTLLVRVRVANNMAALGVSTAPQWMTTVTHWATTNFGRPEGRVLGVY